MLRIPLLPKGQAGSRLQTHPHKEGIQHLETSMFVQSTADSTFALRLGGVDLLSEMLHAAVQYFGTHFDLLFIKVAPSHFLFISILNLGIRKV